MLRDTHGLRSSGARSSAGSERIAVSPTRADTASSRELDLGVCRAFLYEGGGAAGDAVLLPGSRFGIGSPLLFYSLGALLARGFTVLGVHDEYRDGDPVRWASERAEAALAQVEARLVVGKSMASLAAGLVSDRKVPAVWHTPLLREPGVADAIGRSRAPTLLIGGRADALWDAAATGAEVLDVEGADHALAVAGDPLASIEALGKAIRTLDRFVSERVGSPVNLL